jgi:hypothetical protein
MHQPVELAQLIGMWKTLTHLSRLLLIGGIFTTSEELLEQKGAEREYSSGPEVGMC